MVFTRKSVSTPYGVVYVQLKIAAGQAEDQPPPRPRLSDAGPVSLRIAGIGTDRALILFGQLCHYECQDIMVPG